MDTDSVQSYSQTGPITSGADQLQQSGGKQQLPVDVLEAMRSGDLEKAMLLLKKHENAAKDQGVFAKFFALFPLIFFKRVKGKKAEQTVLKRAPLPQKKAEAKVRDQPRLIKEQAELYSKPKEAVSLPKQVISSLRETFTFVHKYLLKPTQSTVQEWMQTASHWIKKRDEAFERLTTALLQLPKKLEEKWENGFQKLAEKVTKIAEPVRKVVQERASEIKEIVASQIQVVQQVTNQAIGLITPPLQAVQERVKRKVEKAINVANRFVRLPLLKMAKWGLNKFKSAVSYYHAVLVTLGGALHRIALFLWQKCVQLFWKLYRFCRALLKGCYFVLRYTPPFVWRLIKSLFRPKRARALKSKR